MKNAIKVLIAVALIGAAVFLFYKDENTMATILVLALLVVPNADKLTDLVINKDGLQAKFETPTEKIEENIKENDEKVTEKNLLLFKNVESKILAGQQKKYGGEIKTLIHYTYGTPDKPQFMYTPDGTLSTDQTLYFFEIKYILKLEFANNIINNTVNYLEKIYKAFQPMAGKKLIMKLILTSGHEIALKDIQIPEGIEIEFVKI